MDGFYNKRIGYNPLVEQTVYITRYNNRSYVVYRFPSIFIYDFSLCSNNRNSYSDKSIRFDGQEFELNEPLESKYIRFESVKVQEEK